MKKQVLNIERLEPKTPLTGDFLPNLDVSLKQVEYLDRGVNVVFQGSSKAYINWRMLATDPLDIGFNVYRSYNGLSPIKINSSPIQKTTDFVDLSFDATKQTKYIIKSVLSGIENDFGNEFSLNSNPSTAQYKSVPLLIPQAGTTPSGEIYTYSANDTSVGDLDGDGEYELIVKWDPSNSKDNSQSGYTGNVFIDAYKLNGKFLWRIDLGKNIRAGAHYTQFIVYDLDGDGKAEVAMKTAPGTLDGNGNAVLLGNDRATVDYRNSNGYILSGPEYLTIFEGSTGKNLVTTYYNPARGTVSSWGDSYGNRVDRFLAGVGYFDGQRPSLLMCRGYYTRTVLVAYDYRDGKLSQRWIFDTNTSGLSGYRGQGSHSLNVADVDNDSKDEIVYGAMTVDHDGKPLYNSTWGHGDALHTADMNLNNPGLEIFMVHENESLHKGNGGTLRDAKTGKLLASIPGTGDVGRGIAMDIDPRYPGYEMWTVQSGLYSSSGTLIQNSRPSFVNMGVWWDGDPLRELLDGTTISDWRIDSTGTGYRVNLIQSPTGLTSNNGTKSTPCLVVDLYGDWREEVIWKKSDSSELQIWSTTIPSQIRLTTLMQDIQYRQSIAWQNVAYNQPPNPSYFIGQDMKTPPQPNVYTIKANFGFEISFKNNTLNSLDIKDGMIFFSTGSYTEADVKNSILSKKLWSSYGIQNKDTLGYILNKDTLAISIAAIGDSNLDGSVDIVDMMNINTNKFNTGVFASWGEGDFNYDGFFDVLDIIDLIGSGLYDSGNYRAKIKKIV